VICRKSSPFLLTPNRPRLVTRTKGRGAILGSTTLPIFQRNTVK